MSKATIHTWAIATSGVTNGAMKATRNMPFSRSRALASSTAAARPPTIWRGTISSHITALLPSEDQNSSLVSR